jgi:hypothetical protein
MTPPERWFRTRPDSSVLPRPRLLARSLLDVRHLDERIAYYERLLGTAADLRMPIPDFGGLELAAVGDLLLIAGERPFTPMQRRTAFSLVVPSLAGQLARLAPAGVTVLEPSETILPGARARIRYPDGAIAELVEHRPLPGELAAEPRPAPEAATGVRLLARRAVARTRFAAVAGEYASALETAVEPGPGSDTALVGSLLLVAADEAASGDAAPIRYALLAASPDPVSELLDGAVAVDHDRLVVSLPDGVRADVWVPEAARR